MSKGTKVFLILFSLFGMTVLLLLLALGISLYASTSLHAPSLRGASARIGVLQLHGVMGVGYSISTEKSAQALKYFGESSGVRAVVVHVNSPGGGVVASEKLHRQLIDFRNEYGKPVVAYMDDVAASGGYYVACAADQIVTTSGCMTGSIGVVLAIQNYEDLFNKVGVHTYWIKGGKYKTAGGEYPLTDEERAMLQSTVDDVYDQFIGIVTNGRGEALAEIYDATEGWSAEAKVRELAEGRIYTGRQAVEIGLADELGSLEDARRLAADLAGVDRDCPMDVRSTHERQPGFFYAKMPDFRRYLPVEEPLLQYRLKLP